MPLKKLNYEKLNGLNPTVYTTITNTLGQSFDLVEHPTKGDEFTVIIMDHVNKSAYDSDFWDTEDMESNGDYMPVFINGEMFLAYECEESELQPTPEQANILALEQALKTQGEQLAAWKPKLSNDCYNDLVGFISACNDHQVNPDGIKRGVHLTEFIQNWELKA
jgi:hypothetical protein